MTWNDERLRSAAKAAGVALWSWNVVTDEVVLDELAYELWGFPVGTPVTFAHLSYRIDPDDLSRVKKEFDATRTLKGSYEIEFRILVGDEPRWISARGQGRDAALIDNVLYAVFMNVTERKQAEEAREMLVGEMSHRIKNLFTIASALTSMAARSTSTKEEMERDLRRRITVLGSAHDLVRPTSGGNRKQEASFSHLLAVLLSPYDAGDGSVGRITIRGPEIDVGEGGATVLALITHELATNSVKYGALSAATGSLNLSYRQDGGEVVVIWTEQGGPPVKDPEGPSGFGSRLVVRSLSGQLGGSIAFDWLPSGLVATMRMSRERLEV